MIDAGTVVTVLQGRFAGAAIGRLDAANKKAIESATKAEAAQVASADRISKSNERLAKSSTKSTAQGAQNLAKLGTVAAKGAAVGLGTLAVATIYAAKTAGDFEKQMRNVNSIAKLSEAGYHKLSK